MTQFSDDDLFDDDDDVLLHQLIHGDTKNTGENTTIYTPSTTYDGNNTSTSGLSATGATDSMKLKLFQAEGEISILRSQLNTLRQKNQHQINSLNENMSTIKSEASKEVLSLKASIERLEDERKFLDNELRSNSLLKKRKIDTKKNGVGVKNVPLNTFVSNSLPGVASSLPVSTTAGSVKPSSSVKIIKITDDSNNFMDHLWNYCINGSNRTCINYLNKVTINFDLKIYNLTLLKKISISSLIIDFFMIKKKLRLDDLITEFVNLISDLSWILVEKNLIASIPYLISLIFASLCFKPAAINQNLILNLLSKIIKFINHYSFLLDSNLDEDDFINYHDVPNQIMIIEKFIFIVSNDILQRLILLSTQFDTDFIKKIWSNDILPTELFKKILPENSERLLNSGQINLIFNYIEILAFSITPETFGYNDNEELTNIEIFNSLFKIFLVDIPLKEDFMFHGLNKVLGNNLDYAKVDSTIPIDQDFLGNNLIIYPQPIPFDLLNQNIENSKLKYQLLWNHEFHLLNLRICTASLIESYIFNHNEDLTILRNKEFYKSIIRVIGFQQNAITNSPRSQYIDKRVLIISKLIKILYYISQDVQDISQLIYPETLYEFFVVILRVAFGSDSLSTEASKFLIDIRSKGYLNPIYNESCELKARELNHITMNETDYKNIGTAESDYANGLEFPYESDTIELAREILNQIVTHEEADNIYFSMNYEEDDGFDEMELAQ